MAVLGHTIAPHYLMSSLNTSALRAGTKPVADGVCGIFSVSPFGVGALGLNQDKPQSLKAARRVSQKPAYNQAEGKRMNDFKQVRGVVEATAQNAPDRYGFRIGQEWYGGFGSCPVEKGNEVEVVFTDNGRYHNVKEVWLADEERPQSNSENGAEEGAEQSSENSANSRIARAVALKCAAAVNCNNYAPADDVLETAEKFERWLRATSR